MKLPEYYIQNGMMNVWSVYYMYIIYQTNSTNKTQSRVHLTKDYHKIS